MTASDWLDFLADVLFFAINEFGGKRNISLQKQPTKLYLHNADFVRNYSNEFTITFTPNTTSVLTRSASYSDIVVENTEKKKFKNYVYFFFVKGFLPYK